MLEESMEIRDAPKFKRAVRLDNIPMTKAYYTAEGFLRDKPILTSCGIFEYANPDGSIRRELRLPEDVFDPESLASFVGKPIVLTHDAGLINKDNVAETQIGTILSEGERSGEDVRAEIIIHDTDEMKSAGLKELSLGYNLDLDETPGIWNGQRYDAVQKNIRINHLALVREARAGEQARLNIDSRDNYALKGGKTMGAKKTRKALHGDDVLTQDEFIKAIEEYKKRKAEREGAQTDEEDVVEPVKGENDELTEKVAAVKARRDRRDEEGDPQSEEEALTTIAHQDEDIDILFDIIDTLLAKQDFDAADDEEAVVAEEEEVVEPVDEEEVAEDAAPVNGVDDLNKQKKNTAVDAEDDELVEEEDEELVEEDEDDVPEDEEFVEEEEIEEDEDDVPEEEDEELVEDADDVEEEEEEEPALNTDSMDEAISRSIREHMILGNLGRQVGLKNLEYKSPMAAKKAIIKAVQPKMRLDGKSNTYIDAAFKYAKAEIKSRAKKDTSTQKKQMFNKDSANVTKKDSAMSARDRMIARMRKENG